MGHAGRFSDYFFGPVVGCYTKSALIWGPRRVRGHPVVLFGKATSQ